MFAEGMPLIKDGAFSVALTGLLVAAGKLLIDYSLRRSVLQKENDSLKLQQALMDQRINETSKQGRDNRDDNIEIRELINLGIFAKPLKPKLVLLVEDNKDTRRLMTNNLRNHGFTVISAENVSESVDLLSANPSVILLDLVLGLESGLTIIDEIRRRKMHMRIIVTTGIADKDRMAELSLRKPNEIYIKPYDFEKMINSLTEPLETVTADTSEI